MTITGQFILKEARHEAFATIAWIFMTYIFLRRTRARYDPTSFTLPLEVATVMDISLSQEDENRKRAHEQEMRKKATQYSGAPGGGTSIPATMSSDMNDAQTQTTASQPDTGVIDFDSDLGTLIGRYNPFEKAYLQPALRANPRAKPEQPFPPSQLGREDIFHGGSPPAGDEVYDTGATVRLKSLNQQDRRLLNHWWQDQLQRCGDQNVLAILTGEECGTLTLSGRVALHDSVPMTEDDVMV